jgi:hypothetical protein
MNTNNNHRIGIYAALLLIAGIVLSGPLGLIVVTAIHPQPAWQDAQTLAANYHPIQTFPFFAGFLLVIGSGLLIATLYRLSAEKDKAVALLAVICTAAFTGLIFLNYICQTTFIPALLANYQPEFDAIIATFSFTNPNSMCWAIEMWGYALLGLATLLLAPVFKRGRVEKITAGLMIANGILSIAGGFITAVNLSWVMTVPGLTFYIAWNALVVLLGVFVIWALYRREYQVEAPAGGAGLIAASTEL